MTHDRGIPPTQAWNKDAKLRCMMNAVRGAIAHDNRLSDINVTRWAEHFDCDADDIRLAWEAELTRTSLTARNAYEDEE
jgi:hypothetical protein